MSIAPEVLVDHFKSIFFTAREPLSLCDPSWAFNVSSADGAFTDSELVVALADLNGNAAPGPDQISAKVIKATFTTPASRVPLLALMNLCFNSGVMPVKWGESEIFILYKGKGSRDDPNNYRGINLINDFSRIFERLLEGRISQWMARENPQGSMQFGFRAGVGTTNAFLLLKTLARSFVRVHGRIGFACFIDLQKAFPSVYRSKVIESLQLANAPQNTIRALAASWSMNNCRLRVNSYLSKPFVVNRGVKEGGINSPSAFSVVYARALKDLGIVEMPSDMRMVDPMKVYFFAFADDLALFSGNLTAVEVVLARLNRTLPDFGMSVNVKKTCWMPFLPTDTRCRVEEPDNFSMRLNTCELECVDEFKYLGFMITSFLDPKLHIVQKVEMMLNAARSMGRLIRSLQITNLSSIRTYFQSLISSQLYGLECFNFKMEDYYRAAKVFLQEIFCLPSSFPINVARSLLRLPVFDAVLLERRINFLERAFRPVHGSASLTAKALEYDQEVLRGQRIGFSHDLFSFLSTFFDASRLDDMSISDIEYLQDLRDEIVHQRADEFRNSFRLSSGLNFFVDLSPDAVMPRQFGEFLGTLEFENARVVLICLGDVFRFSLAATNSRCPFCPIELHLFHLFRCPNSPFQVSLPSWSDFVQAFQVANWSGFILILFQCLLEWDRNSHFFHTRASKRIRSFFD